MSTLMRAMPEKILGVWGKAPKSIANRQRQLCRIRSICRIPIRLSLFTVSKPDMTPEPRVPIQNVDNGPEEGCHVRLLIKNGIRYGTLVFASRPSQTTCSCLPCNDRSWVTRAKCFTPGPFKPYGNQPGNNLTVSIWRFRLPKDLLVVQGRGVDKQTNGSFDGCWQLGPSLSQGSHFGVREVVDTGKCAAFCATLIRTFRFPGVFGEGSIPVTTQRQKCGLERPSIGQ